MGGAFRGAEILAATGDSPGDVRCPRKKLEMELEAKCGGGFWWSWPWPLSGCAELQGRWCSASVSPRRTVRWTPASTRAQSCHSTRPGCETVVRKSSKRSSTPTSKNKGPST